MPRTLIQPDANAVSRDAPNRRIHVEPEAAGGARISSPANERPFAVSLTRAVGSIGTPAAR